MRVFVTGASGHIGSALIPELVAAGHEVVGLARSDRSAGVIAALGAEVQRGELDDLDVLRAAAAAAGGVIHLAYGHGGDFASGAAADLRAVETMGAALEGSGRPLVITSGTLLLAMLGLGRTGNEEDRAPGGPRIDSENAAVALGRRGVRSSVIRLSPTVHSSLDHHGFIPRLIATARERGVSAYVGDGANRWPAVHTLDAARLYRLALESAPAGSRLHGVADEGVPFSTIAEAIGRQLGVPVTSVPAERAPGHFGFLGALVQLDNPASSRRTRELVGWTPEHPGLVEDIDAGHYFEGAVTGHA